MTAFYNEIDPVAAQWLRNLIAAGHIASGIVDERDIRDIRPAELEQFTQVHFFAGIGIHSAALRRAGWKDEWPIWTGSCPCQPFSAAGKRSGIDDERHLWPHWHWLIEQCGPAIVGGEQVASKDGLAWLDLVSTDMEGSNYAVAAADICAAGFSGAHIRQRLYFVGMAEADHEGSQGWLSRWTDSQRQYLDRYARHRRAAFKLEADLRGGMADADGGNASPERQQSSRIDRLEPENGCTFRQANRGIGHQSDNGVAGGPLKVGRNAVDWLFCRDGLWWPVEPESFPLADASPNRMGRLRAYGNGLDLETAAEFYGSVLDLICGIQPQQIGQMALL